MKNLIFLLLAVTVSFTGLSQKDKGSMKGKKATTLKIASYACSEHPDVVSNAAGKCSKCGKNLSLSGKEQMKMDVVKGYACPMHPEETSSEPGKCTKCNMDMTATTTVPSMYACKMHPNVISDEKGVCAKCGKNLSLSKKEQMKKDVMKAYTCPMHPNEMSMKDGNCTQCGMDLTPVKSKKG
ncbi:MAG: heavy metal-binding domain-containing protein [Bacteroidota bacterium]